MLAPIIRDKRAQRRRRTGQRVCGYEIRGGSVVASEDAAAVATGVDEFVVGELEFAAVVGAGGVVGAVLAGVEGLVRGFGGGVEGWGFVKWGWERAGRGATYAPP